MYRHIYSMSLRYSALHVFTLEILTVHDATEEETRAGGAIVTRAEVDPSRLKPV